METQVIHSSSSPLRRFIPSAIFAILTSFAVTISAQQQPISSISLDEAAQRGQNFYQQSAVTGMVLVIVRKHEVLIKGYGETYPGSGHAPDARSEIRLCSVSKVFTTDLLARLAANGKVNFKDPLQRYAPHGTVVPMGPGNTPITLVDLATHTAGLTREVSSYPRKTPHFTFPDYKYRWDWLPKQTIKIIPGTAAVYSNVGFDLLGDALASASGTSYAHLLHNTLLQPLGMWDTTLVPSADQCARLLQGTGNEGPCTDTQPSGPSGGIYSTATDMAKFLQYLLQIPGAPVQPPSALAVYTKPQQLTSTYGLSHAGNPTGIGLAWMQLGELGTPSMIMEKTGGGAGFGTYVALSPQRQTGIFLAVTEGKGQSHVEFYHEANNLLAALAGVPPLPEHVRPTRRAPKHRATQPQATPRRPHKAAATQRAHRLSTSSTKPHPKPHAR